MKLDFVLLVSLVLFMLFGTAEASAAAFGDFLAVLFIIIIVLVAICAGLGYYARRCGSPRISSPWVYVRVSECLTDSSYRCLFLSSAKRVV
jgi:hypothetical protein